jgi:hypothetical protein
MAERHIIGLEWLDFQNARAFSTDRDSAEERIAARCVEMIRPVLKAEIETLTTELKYELTAKIEKVENQTTELTAKIGKLTTELRSELGHIRREAGKTREASYRCGQCTGFSLVASRRQEHY